MLRFLPFFRECDYQFHREEFSVNITKVIVKVIVKAEVSFYQKYLVWSLWWNYIIWNK